LAFF
jgi:hypothetical protein